MPWATHLKTIENWYAFLGGFHAVHFLFTNQRQENRQILWVQEPAVCKNMAWGDATFKGKKAVGTTAGALYEVEHILEWQLVTSFFDYLNEDIFKDDTFDHPNPLEVVSGKRAKINFCKYWAETWKDSPMFALGGAVAKRDPMTHLKWAYPGTQNYIEEFVMLEDNINAPAKTQVSSLLAFPA
jgi:hypothetical protein